MKSNIQLNIDFDNKSKSLWISDESSTGIRYDNINSKEDLINAVNEYMSIYV